MRQNLYTIFMRQLDNSGFQWLNRKRIDSFDVNPIGENSSHEYILEVDLKYPDKLHEPHNNYPLAISRKT